MGSVVLDAVNSFFHSSSSHPQHDIFRETPRPHNQSPAPASKRSRTPSRSEAHMSESSQRATSSSAATPQQKHTGQRDQDAPNLQDARDSEPVPRPSSPSLGAQAAPPSDGSQPAAAPPADPPTPSAQPQRPRKIKVRDLEHIQSFATEDMRSFSEIRSRSRSRSRGEQDDGPQYEISEMKVSVYPKIVVGRLYQGDRCHSHRHRRLLSAP